MQHCAIFMAAGAVQPQAVCRLAIASNNAMITLNERTWRCNLRRMCFIQCMMLYRAVVLLGA